jgi:hypothetical protein
MDCRSGNLRVASGLSWTVFGFVISSPSNCRIEKAGDIGAAIEAGIASGKPNLIEIIISP